MEDGRAVLHIFNAALPAAAVRDRAPRLRPCTRIPPTVCGTPARRQIDSRLGGEPAMRRRDRRSPSECRTATRSKPTTSALVNVRVTLVLRPQTSTANTRPKSVIMSTCRPPSRRSTKRTALRCSRPPEVGAQVRILPGHQPISRTHSLTSENTTERMAGYHRSTGRPASRARCRRRPQRRPSPRR